MTGAGPCADVANGLILRDAVATGSNALPPMTLDYVINNDGTAYTLLLSENTQSPPPAGIYATPKTHNWYDCDTTSPSSTYQIKQTFGFAITASVYPSALQTFASVYAVSGTMYSATNPMIANINSGHGGGAVVAFCDNHVIFLRDDAGLNPATNPTNVGSSPTVYQILVSPEGSKNGRNRPRMRVSGLAPGRRCCTCWPSTLFAPWCIAPRGFCLSRTHRTGPLILLNLRMLTF